MFLNTTHIEKNKAKRRAIARPPFAHGQTYVALSRSRSLGGIALTQEIWPNDVIVDKEIVKFFEK